MPSFRKRFVYETNNPIIIGLIFLLMILVFSLLGEWYYNSGVPLTHPDGRTNFWFGLLHGALIAPSFISSWFNPNITIYQAPNDGFWYNLGFIMGGLGVLLWATMEHEKDN